MNTIPQLIAHYDRRIKEIDEEIERISHQQPSKYATVQDHDSWIDGWVKQRQTARDTIAYLKTLESMKQREDAR